MDDIICLRIEDVIQRIKLGELEPLFAIDEYDVEDPASYLLIFQIIN